MAIQNIFDNSVLHNIKEDIDVALKKISCKYNLDVRAGHASYIDCRDDVNESSSSPNALYLIKLKIWVSR
jgi:hypothetical protein